MVVVVLVSKHVVSPHPFSFSSSQVPDGGGASHSGWHVSSSSVHVPPIQRHHALLLGVVSGIHSAVVVDDVLLVLVLDVLLVLLVLAVEVVVVVPTQGTTTVSQGSLGA